MKKLVIGILAHVDSGKTTLSESILYNTGIIKTIGRVDHGNSYLDTDQIEKERGITVFSKQAVFEYKSSHITLLDTPGHADFSAEAERSLKILDYAVLIISSTDGIQSHTQTLCNLLSHYRVPTFIFINKTDLSTADTDKTVSDIKHAFGDRAIDFSNECDFYENTAMADEKLMQEYFEKGTISVRAIAEAILKRRIFPYCSGSALKNEGVIRLLDIIDAYTLPGNPNESFGAKVYKTTEDNSGNLLTHMKITGGTLNVKDLVCINDNKGKINEIRIYSGAKYRSVQSAEYGDVCAVTGIPFAHPGQGLGFENDFSSLISEAVFTYSVKLPTGYDINKALDIFKKLSLEETQIDFFYNEQKSKINVRIMGIVQLEIIKRILKDRFKLDAEFEDECIIYKETISDTVEGVGHFEPLRHYAEVHLKLQPGEKGSGISIASECSEDILNKNYQNLILAHISEKTHIGVLTGSPITDIKITLVSGKAHPKHTEGGDFREATYRAVRQGLMQAKSVLLEPWYNFTLEIPINYTGRALTDLELAGAKTDPTVHNNDNTVISGSIPAVKLNELREKLLGYTHGTHKLSLTFDGYNPCTEQKKIIDKFAYDCEADTLNTADSVFCSHGSGFIVKWNDIFDHMHLPLQKSKSISEAVSVSKYRSMVADEEELLRIFEATYGKVKTKSHRPLKSAKTVEHKKSKNILYDETYLLIDGYNMIFAWRELKEIARESLDTARALLINKVCNYRAMRDENIIIVFDAYRVPGNTRETETHHGVSVIYTKEAETADAYIEKTSKVLSKNYRVKVATSDNAEQIIVFGNGAYRISALEFEKEVSNAESEMRSYLSQ